MDFIQFITLLLSMAGLFFWARSESRTDHREVIALIMAIKYEIKDFHGRLCALEEKYKQIK